MKIKLYFLGFLFLSVLSASCTSEDFYETDGATRGIKNNSDHYSTNKKVKDKLIRVRDTVSEVSIMAVDSENGDPINPKPPRKD